jgi:hypothetical protein
VGLVLPEYSLMVNGSGARSGLQWEVPVLIGNDQLDFPVWGGSASISWYPGAPDVTLRATASVLAALKDSDRPWDTDVPGVSVGLGGFWNESGYGPRIEARFRHWCWAGFFLSAAFEPTVAPELTYGAEFALGLAFPVLL